MEFSPGADFYAAAAQVIPLLLLALVFEARAFSRVEGALTARVAADQIALNQREADWRRREEDVRRQIAEARATAKEDLAGFLEAITAAAGTPSDRARSFEVGRELTLRASAEERRNVVWLLIVGVACALTAEAVALAALVLSDPPDVLAVVVLAGAAVLLGTLARTLVHLVVHEVNPKGTDTSGPPESGW